MSRCLSIKHQGQVSKMAGVVSIVLVLVFLQSCLFLLLGWIRSMDEKAEQQQSSESRTPVAVETVEHLS